MKQRQQTRTGNRDAAKRKAAFRTSTPGSTPGIESIAGIHEPPAAGSVRIRCTDYGPDRVETHDVPDLNAVFRQSRPDWCKVRWINVDGLHPHVVNQLRHQFQFHTLAAEDVLRVPQRPKLETFEDHLFIVARMLVWQENTMISEQVSFFLYENTLLTFQERAGDVWDPIRQRLEKPGSRLRTFDVSYLLYALLDAVVDHCFPILENIGDLLEGLEDEITRHPTQHAQRRLHVIKRELAMLRRVVWPLREVLSGLCRDDTEGIAPNVKAYLRDVSDHTVQVMDIVDSCRDMAASLNDLYMSAVSNRMNEVMKVLTIMTSFFIPITFIAGVYGMNFEDIPGLHWKHGYTMFWGICFAITLGLAVFFIRKGWIGRR
ncbi:MAG TPA: magnesium/cobalt transporter CorA [Verrucomicrobiota bacterium]|nr:magnesium/cobalt transporter CorA [Verrucomicrobiota bacterium]